MLDGSLHSQGGTTRSPLRLLERLNLDPPLLGGVAALCLFGLAVIYSAGGQDLGIVIQQAIRLGVAVAVMLVLAQISPLTMRLWTPAIYLGGVVLLLLVMWVGVESNGARRWLDLGVVTIQPSEGMKLVVPMMVAGFLHYRTVPPSLRHAASVLVLIGVPVVLVARQPDLGTAVLIGSAGLFTLFLAGLSWRYIAVMAAGIGGAMPLIWMSMREYQKQRVLTFLNPEQNPLGSGYHIIQSKIAIGSGGLFGKGWLNGSQAHLQFLPERSTDFIFAVIAEEFGLLGLLILLAVYLFVIVRGMIIALRAQETFDRLVAGSLSLTFFVYVFVNAGMVSGLLPVVGIPLPLISYGGTSMVTLLAGFGILMAINGNKKLVP